MQTNLTGIKNLDVEKNAVKFLDDYTEIYLCNIKGRISCIRYKMYQSQRERFITIKLKTLR